MEPITGEVPVDSLDSTLLMRKADGSIPADADLTIPLFPKELTLAYKQKPSTTNVPRRFCKECGAPCDVSAVLCDNCFRQKTERTVPPTKHNNLLIVILVPLVVLLLLGIVAGIHVITGDSLFHWGTVEAEVPTYASDNGENVEESMLAIAQRYSESAVLYQEHAYAIFNYKDEALDDFDDCEAFCEGMGGHLAVIDSQDENDFLYNYVIDSGLTLSFFGFTDQKTEGDWQWVTGNSTYTNWLEGQPNNGASNGNGEPENYAEFSKKAADGTWNDAPFGINTYHFICEWE